MEKDTLKKIRKNLPKGSIQTIAEKFNLSNGHVSQILRGHRNNNPVLLEAVKIVSEHRKKHDEAIEFLHNI